MSNIVEADYRVVPERTLPVIASEILYIESQVAKTALDGAIQIGNKLKEAKGKVDHGQWGIGAVRISITANQKLKR